MVYLRNIDPGVGKRTGVGVFHGRGLCKGRSFTGPPGLLITLCATPPVNPLTLGHTESSGLCHRADDQPCRLFRIQYRIEIFRIRERNHPIFGSDRCQFCGGPLHRKPGIGILCRNFSKSGKHPPHQVFVFCQRQTELRPKRVFEQWINIRRLSQSVFLFQCINTRLINTYHLRFALSPARPGKIPANAPGLHQYFKIIAAGYQRQPGTSIDNFVGHKVHQCYAIFTTRTGDILVRRVSTNTFGNQVYRICRMPADGFHQSNRIQLRQQTMAGASGVRCGFGNPYQHLQRFYEVVYIRITIHQLARANDYRCVLFIHGTIPCELGDNINRLTM